MNKPEMMNYLIRADSKELRDRILAWAEKNIETPWPIAFHTDDDVDGKWELFIDGGTVGTKDKLQSSFRGEPFTIEESGESWLLLTRIAGAIHRQGLAIR